MASNTEPTYFDYTVARDEIIERVLDDWEDDTYPYGNDALLALKARAIESGHRERIDRSTNADPTGLAVFESPEDAWQAWAECGKYGEIYQDTINPVYIVDPDRLAEIIDWARYFKFSLWGDSSMTGNDYDQMLHALDNPDESLEYLGLRRVDPETIRP